MRLHRPFRRASLTRMSLAVLALVMGVALSPVLLPVAPARATEGVDDYPANLKSAAQDSLVDPWNFYNRECTSFVAWRLNNDAGIKFHNYYLGPHWGDASHWKTAAVSAGITVDDNPTVGAIAWWASGSAGSSRGHVAWVRTVSSTAISIEEYNYLRRGYYDTRTIAKTDAVYPTGFIHLGDTAMKATTRPTISGTSQVGVKLTAAAGTWTPSGATYTYRWLANGTAISGATYRTFTPRAAQLGQSLQFEVTATKDGVRSATIRSFKTAAVAPGVITMTAAPAITGQPKVGVQLSTTAGTWSPTGAYAYQWYADGVAITGATKSIFTPTAAEKAKAITSRVTVTKTGYTTVVGTSAATQAVAPGTFTNTAPPTITGTPQVGRPLTASPGTWSPNADYAYRWLVDGTPVTGATGSSYTPTADDLRKPVTVQVTASQPGYTSATLSSAATDPVAPGTFLNTSDPTISGTAKVGVLLTADPGDWSPEPSFAYQWFADGTAIAGATEQTFTPTPAEYQHKLTVQVTATRRGYLTALAPSPATAPVAPGVISQTQRPTITGRPVVGATLTTSPGEWTVEPASVAYQWLADGEPIFGATESTYQPTEADLDRHLAVEVTVGADGYQPASATSVATGVVVLGKTSLASPPRLSGRPVYGETLTVSTGAATPAEATSTYQWFRGPTPISGATAASYTLKAADVSKFITARVIVAAPHWESSTAKVTTAKRVLTVPRLATRTSVSGSHAVLSFVVVAPGIPAPGGVVRVLLRGEEIGHARITDGHGRVRVGPFAHGRHRLVLVYDGGRFMLPLRQSLVLTID
jgi:surface antigen